MAWAKGYSRAVKDGLKPNLLVILDKTAYAKKLSNNCAQLCVFNLIFVSYVRGSVCCQLLQLVLAFISQFRNDIETWFLHQTREQALAE